MNNKIKIIGIVLTLALFLTLSGANCAKKEITLAPLSGNNITPVIGQVIAPIQPVKLSDGKYYIMYELELTNASSSDMTLEKLLLQDPLNDDAVVSELSADYIKAHLRTPTSSTQPTNVLKPYNTGFLVINLALESGNVPKAIDHVLDVHTDTPNVLVAQNTHEIIARTEVLSDNPVVISAPLSGNNWMAGNVSNNYGHRNAFFPINGEEFVPERWAVDWIKLADDDKPVTGDPLVLKNYPGYEQDLLAVKDAKVVKVVDGLPDLAMGEKLSNISLDTLGGNFITLDIGDGLLAFYAHIIPGTIKVKEGDTVKKGQVLGLLGNSGNSDAPHLHFHICKGSTVIACQGVPYVIDKFEVTGQAQSVDDVIDDMANQTVVDLTQNFTGTHAKEMPADLSIINFVK